MLNNHNIILLFSDFYNILSFLIDLIDGFKTFLDPDRDFWLDPDRDFWLDPDPYSMNMDPKH